MYIFNTRIYYILTGWTLFLLKIAASVRPSTDKNNDEDKEDDESALT